MPLISREMRDKLSLMKFPLVWGFFVSVIASPMGSVVDGAAVDSIDVGSGDGAMDGLCVVGPSVGANTGLAVGLPGVTVGAGVGTGVGLGNGLDVGGSVGFGDGAIDGS